MGLPLNGLEATDGAPGMVKADIREMEIARRKQAERDGHLLRMGRIELTASFQPLVLLGNFPCPTV